MDLTRKALLPAVCFALFGCAPMISTSPSTLDLASSSVASRHIQILTAVPIQLGTGYTRTLRENSAWSSVGRVPQGEVFRPVGTVFTIEGRQVHEAYLVINEKRLVGFYLPGEQNYSPLSTAVPLNLGEQQ